MNDTVVVLSAASAIVAGTPILLAALGEMIAERSGVMNLGVEGMMLLGAVVAFWTGVHTGSLTLSLLAGGARRRAAGLRPRLAGGVVAREPDRVGPVARDRRHRTVGVPRQRRRPVRCVEAPNGVDVHPLLPSPLSRPRRSSGPIVLGHDIVVYASWILVAVVGYVLYRTSAGLSLRAIGEDPAAADAAGLNVTRTRYAGHRARRVRRRLGRDVPRPRRARHLAERTDGRGRLDRRRAGDPRRLAALAGVGRCLRVRRAPRPRASRSRSPRCRCRRTSST